MNNVYVKKYRRLRRKAKSADDKETFQYSASTLQSLTKQFRALKNERVRASPNDAGAASPRANGEVPSKLLLTGNNFMQYSGKKRCRAQITNSQPRILSSLTTNLLSTYKRVSPDFRYNKTLNPRRVLTKDCSIAGNYGYDNELCDLIISVNDILISERGQKYQAVDMAGQGTFGQVIKCRAIRDDNPMNLELPEFVAVKVIKNKPAYYAQASVEIKILGKLEEDNDPDDIGRMRIVRMFDSFDFKNHLCIVFEMLSINLYELIKQNKFKGLSIQLVADFTDQILDALQVLSDMDIVNCDLKPENILLENLYTPKIKLIDFGSACYENQTVYTYIQSRFYRAPEVIIGLPYASAIDLWSLGCITCELFLGLPVFPGVSEHNQLSRIISILGEVPDEMLSKGKSTRKFFNQHIATENKWNLKSPLEWKEQQQLKEVEITRIYFREKTLPEMIRRRVKGNIPTCLASSSSNTSISDTSSDNKLGDEELNQRASLADFVLGLLRLEPTKRWTAWQAKSHPFVSRKPFYEPHIPKEDPKFLRKLQASNPQSSSLPQSIVRNVNGSAYASSHRRQTSNIHHSLTPPKPGSLSSVAQFSPPVRPTHPYPLGNQMSGKFDAGDYCSPYHGGKSTYYHDSLQHMQMNSMAMHMQVQSTNAEPMHYGSCPPNVGGYYNYYWGNRHQGAMFPQQQQQQQTYGHPLNNSLQFQFDGEGSYGHANPYSTSLQHPSGLPPTPPRPNKSKKAITPQQQQQQKQHRMQYGRQQFLVAPPISHDVPSPTHVCNPNYIKHLHSSDYAPEQFNCE